MLNVETFLLSLCIFTGQPESSLAKGEKSLSIKLSGGLQTSADNTWRPCGKSKLCAAPCTGGGDATDPREFVAKQPAESRWGHPVDNLVCPPEEMLSTGNTVFWGTQTCEGYDTDFQNLPL